MSSTERSTRNLIVILGDQLNIGSSAFDEFDKENDRVWMAEASQESTHVWSHKARIVLFLSAMRHFKQELETQNYRVDYHSLDDPKTTDSLNKELDKALDVFKPDTIVFTEPGEWRVQDALTKIAKARKVEVDIRPDRHFICSIDEFKKHAKGRKQLRLEYFYRELRRKINVLMDGEGPEGGEWNYDQQNRKSFGKSGPGRVSAPRSFKPDKITKEVIKLVNETFAGHPGSLDSFDYPVTHDQAKQALDDFIKNRLPNFGDYQDALWTNEPFLYHSRLSSSLNLKLLDPRDVISAAETAYKKNKVSLASVEGFIRQVLGWREYVRGIYWLFMPDYSKKNALKADHSLPEFYWTGKTDMQCLQQTISQTLEHGYAHHIQRLMVTGLFAQLYGVNPKEVHEWYLAVYVDAVEWVELPNTLGMSQFADGGLMASKPYAATGKYIQRMSNYCQNCKYNPAESIGEDACPFTTLYWDFLMRHENELSNNQRMSLQVRNLNRLSEQKKKDIKTQAKSFRNAILTK